MVELGMLTRGKGGLSAGGYVYSKILLRSILLEQGFLPGAFGAFRRKEGMKSSDGVHGRNWDTASGGVLGML